MDNLCQKFVFDNFYSKLGNYTLNCCVFHLSGNLSYDTRS